MITSCGKGHKLLMMQSEQHLGRRFKKQVSVNMSENVAMLSFGYWLLTATFIEHSPF